MVEKGRKQLQQLQKLTQFSDASLPLNWSTGRCETFVLSALSSRMVSAYCRPKNQREETVTVVVAVVVQPDQTLASPHLSHLEESTSQQAATSDAGMRSGGPSARPIQSQTESGAPPRPHAERRSHTPLWPNQPAPKTKRRQRERSLGESCCSGLCFPALVQIADVLGWLPVSVRKS